MSRQLAMSSRLGSPDATGRCSCSLFAAWFPGGATISRPYISCTPAPLRTVLALLTHTAPHMVLHEDFRAMRRSFVATASPLLGTGGVSSRRSTMCRLLSSRGITPLHGYYKAIRLPMRDKPLLPFTIVGTLSHPWKRAWGLPGCRDILVSCMPWSKTPRKCAPPGHPGGAHVDFRLCNDVVLPNSFFRGSIPSALRALLLTLYGLRPTCLRSYA